MSDVLEIAKFDAGVQTPSGYKQFSAVDTAGSFIGNREYKESFDKFKSGCTCEDSYIWRALSAVADQTGLVLYDNVKNYIDYITNVDVCKVQALRSMVKMYGLEYKVFDRLDLLPVEILDLINIFSINKKHLLYGDKLLSEYRQRLSAEGVIRNYDGGLDCNQVSAVLSGQVLDYDCLNGGKYREFIEKSFYGVLKDFLSLSYEEGGNPIYTFDNKDGIYNEISNRRDKYMLQYAEGTDEYARRQYKILNNVPLTFDESAILDNIEAGKDLESNYSGIELHLIQMERESRQKSHSQDSTSRYAFYKKQRVLEYANFVVNKYFSDYGCSDLSVYDYDKNYFQVSFNLNSDTRDASQIYADSGIKLVYYDQDKKLKLNTDMILSVAKSLTDTSLYISRIREKIKLQTRKNYMKGTYDLMLYVINEFLVDYSRLNPIFRNVSGDYEFTGKSVSELLRPIYQDLSSHDVNNLTAVEYFDETEYYNINADTDGRSNEIGTNDRFWRDPNGESLMRRDGIDRDFDIKSITSFYMDTLGVRDNYISDENSLCAFLDAVYGLGAVDSFVHNVSVDVNDKESAGELFGAQVEKYGDYSDDLYNKYLSIRRAWKTLNSYLSGNEYDYQVSDCVSAQILSVSDYIKQLVFDSQVQSVSSVYDKYIERVDLLSSLIDQGVNAYDNLISGEYAFYFQKASDYKYCFEDFSDKDTYKHQWYTDSYRDAGLKYWYDMVQSVYEYAQGSDEGGDYITNWPIRDTIKFFYGEFTKLSTWYLDMVAGKAVPDIQLTCQHNWNNEYGFVDISAVSLEDELKYGYDFMNSSISTRKQYILDVLNGLKDQALDLQSLSQGIKNSLTQAVAQYNDNREGQKLGDTVIYAVSLNKDSGHDDYSRCARAKNKPGGQSSTYKFIVKQNVGGIDYYYYAKKDEDSGDFSYFTRLITGYNEEGTIRDRCAQLKQYMSAPTSFTLMADRDPVMNYEMMDEGVYASISQVEKDLTNLENSVQGLINQVKQLGYDFTPGSDTDNTITKLIEFINSNINDSVIEKDEKVRTYRQYLRAIVQLSSLYLPVKYEYDSISKDQKQVAYMSEFQPDTDMTLAALNRLSSYSVQKDAGNKAAIITSIQQMFQKYQESVLEYQKIASELENEYMLPSGFQPYSGYVEEMTQLMYDALYTDIDDKTWRAHIVSEEEYSGKIIPAAQVLIQGLLPYANSMLRLPDVITKRLDELYYFDKPSYLRQKEMFLTYGGRSFCYYPYYNFKNVVHSSYQVHPFMWNFIRREQAYSIVQKTFFSVNVDELERANIAQNWKKFFGDYGESKYNDLSKPRYPDYSGYQSRYEDSNHVVDNTQFVSEVVDYDGAFYPPAIDWIRANTIEKAISSIQDTKYSQNIAREICDNIYALSSLGWASSVLPVILSCTQNYCTSAYVQDLTSYVYCSPNCYDSGRRALSDVSEYEICRAVTDALSAEDTFYGRFYRQLRLDQEQQKETKLYIVNQLSSYWGPDDAVPGGGPCISTIVSDITLDKAFDIYKYGIDSYGNMYCLYKQYDWEITRAASSRGGLSYKFKRNTPGSLWIRLKNHPIAFPAFSGQYPNVYMETSARRHIAFQNLFDLYNVDPETREQTPKIGKDVFPISASLTKCIYDFEFTKDRNDITFVTKMRTSDLTCDSPNVQCYENSWLVHCRPMPEVITSETGANRTALTLYCPSKETDYYQSGDNYLQYSRLSSESSLDGDGITLYQYIGSYLKGNNGIYHAYAQKHVHRDEGDDVHLMCADDSVSCVVREVIDGIKIFPQINGVYSGNPIIGALTDGSLKLVGPDICLAYDEEYNILNFAAQTALASDVDAFTDTDRISLRSNAVGATIDDPSGKEMNSHDIFDSNVTLFRKQVISRGFKDVRGSGNDKYSFNTNADMSYFPVYPGAAGTKKLYARPQYEYYNVELLGTAKDISQQISFVNPNPNPYLDENDILANFQNARVYQDFNGYVDETFKLVNNRLIGANSDVLVPGWRVKTNSAQQVVFKDDFIIWQIGLNKLYQNISFKNMMKLKVLAFNKKCYGKNPYVFSDISALATGWVDLHYDAEEGNASEYSVISAEDFVFGYNNRVIAQSTLDGVEMNAVSDSNHVYNVKSMQARFVIDEERGVATLEFRFNVKDPSMSRYTYVPADQMQVALMDVHNLDVFNYFHYLDTYGVLRVIDNFSTMEEFNRYLTNRGPGYTIYYAGQKFTPEQLQERLKSYFEYRGRMIPLSSVDLSQYDSLSDVYILQGGDRLQFKVDEDFRYELSHPGYFYPMLNTKFPINSAQYAMTMTSFRENGAADVFTGLFDQSNLFILDMNNPDRLVSEIGRVDIPIILDNDTECVFAYEDYMDYADGEISSRRNCDLYDVSDPYVLQFVQFEVDSAEERGIPGGTTLEVPDSLLSAVDMDTALNRIVRHLLNERGVDGVYPAFLEKDQLEYSQEYIGFTIGRGSLSNEQLEKLSRIYVNYRRYDDSGSPKIQLYFNYMNYLDSPYLRVQDGRTYIDLVNNTYLSLKQDEDGVLDIVTQFRYYKGGTLCGYKNVKLASYQIYNISDDKPKFLIKNIDSITRDDGSNRHAAPLVSVRACDVELDAKSEGGEDDRMRFDVVFALETSMPLQKIEFYIDYPSDFMEFTSVSGKNWELDDSQPGYAKLVIDPSARVVQIPARTIYTKSQLADLGDQSVIAYVDSPAVVGSNGFVANVKSRPCQVTVFVNNFTERLNVLLTDRDSSAITVFNSQQPKDRIKGIIL